MNMTMAQYRAYVRRTSGAGRIKRHATRTKAEEGPGRPVVKGTWRFLPSKPDTVF